MRFTTRQALKISALVDALKLDIDVTKDVEVMGAEVITHAIMNIHKFEQEVVDLVMAFTGCTSEEALDYDLLGAWDKFIKSKEGKTAVSFFQSASNLKSQDQD